MDFLTQVSAEHDAMVDDLAAQVASRLRPALLEKLRLLTSAARTSLDEEAAIGYVERELRHEVHRALTGYRDWLALTLWRQGPSSGKTVALPKPKVTEVARIVEEYDLDDDQSLALVIEAVGARPTKMPVVGRISGNKVEPDYEALSRWASSYDLTE